MRYTLHNIKKKLIIISFITILITTIFAIQSTTLLQAQSSNKDFDAENRIRNTTTFMMDMERM